MAASCYITSLTKCGSMVLNAVSSLDELTKLATEVYSSGPSEVQFPLEQLIEGHLHVHNHYFLIDIINMSCSTEGASADGPEQTKFQKLKAHAKEFIEASPEEHKQ